MTIMIPSVPWRWRRVRRLALTGLVVSAVVVPAAPAQATFSAENGRIAFRRFLNEDKTWGAVFTIRPDGTGERQVTHPLKGFVDRNPDISPDGKVIAFEREGVDCAVNCAYDEIFTVHVNGTHLRRLTRNRVGQSCGSGGSCNGSPAWSPDGRRIAFQRASGPVVNDLIQNAGLAIMNADGSGIHRITQLRAPATGEDSDPQFSPDGRQIVFQRRNVRSALPVDGVALWILDLATGRERRITPYPMRAGDTPDWSPDGRRILFHDNLDNAPDVSPNLFTVRPDGTGLTQLTFASGGDPQYLGSSYSPDGHKIAVGRRPETGGVNADVMIMNVDGTGIHRLTHTVLYDSYPDWGPDS
jgi:TolB protein